MAVISFSFNKANGAAFTESDLSTIASELETFFNSTKISIENIIDLSLPIAVLNEAEFVDQDTLVFGASGITINELNNSSYSVSGLSNRSIGIGSLSRTKLAPYVLVDTGSVATSQQLYSQTIASAPSTTASITTQGHCPLVFFRPGSETIPSADDITLTINGSTYGGATLDVNDFNMPLLWLDEDNLNSVDITEAEADATYLIDGSSADLGALSIFDGGY